MVGTIAVQALPDLKIIVMKLKGKKFFPIQVHSEGYYFYYASIIFIGDARSIVQAVCQVYIFPIKTITC